MPTPFVEPPGTPLWELDTPALVMDIARVEDNIARMAAFLKDNAPSSLAISLRV